MGVVLASLAGVATAAAPVQEQRTADHTVTVTFVVVNLGPAPSGSVRLSFTAGFTASNLVSAQVAPNDPGLGLLTWQRNTLQLGAQSGSTEVQITLEFELSSPGTRILGDAQIPDGTAVDASLPGEQPLWIGGGFGIPATAPKGASRSPSLAASPDPADPGASVALVGSVAGRCAAGARVTLTSNAFAHRHRLDGVPAVETVAWPDGELALVTTVPRADAAGRYAVTARCDGRSLGTVAHLRVRA